MAKKETKKSSPKVKPLGDRVLIREIVKDGSETASGIIIPDTVNEDKGSKKGEVIAVGPGRIDDCKTMPMQVSIGDTVLFQWGDQVKIGGVEYYIVSESNIIAVIN